MKTITIYALTILSLLSNSSVSSQQIKLPSAENDFLVLEKSPPNNQVESGGQTQMVLGRKIQNPYSVANMQKAFNLYSRSMKTAAPSVRATHQYIEITPSNESHLQLLDKLDAEGILVLHDYPLDYEITTEGDFYVMPANEKDLYHPVYTVIPVGYKFPASLPYRIIEDVYETKESESDVESVALALAGQDTELDCPRSMNCNDPNVLLEMFKNPTQKSLFGGRRYRPHGYVKVKNTETGKWDELKRARISIGRGIWWRYTDTDNEGHFSSPKKYRGKVRIRAKWRSDIATIRKSWNEMLGIQVSDHLMTIKRSNNGRTKYIEPNDERLWYKGTVHNGLIKYNDYATARGVDEPISNANVWVWKNGRSAGSTPMLFKYRNLNQIASFTNIGASNVWDVLVNALAGSAIEILPSHLRPDMIYSGLKHKKVGNQVNTARIQQLTIHESAHYSHAAKAGKQLWAKVFASELANDINHNDPYVDGSEPSFTRGKLIALAEGWATFFEYKAMEHYYRKVYDQSTWKLNPGNHMEGFDMYTRPMTEERSDTQSWFLSGLIWDIQDAASDSNNELRDGTDGSEIGPLIDNLHIQSQSELYPVFSGLRAGIEDACQYGQYLADT
ncbi:hypothetical protein, partial [Moorena sp. SIO1F2]|uniref:hypothetical protein n=1 Tax=Moorena sp. SIO1F2 TaxID=2607819 RepID=UPI0025E6A63E